MMRLFSILVLVSVPLLMMLQVLQSYRYAVALEDAENYEAVQLDMLEDNKRILAGIAVFSAPARVYRVAEESLELAPASPEKVLQVRFPDTTGGAP